MMYLFNQKDVTDHRNDDYCVPLRDTAPSLNNLVVENACNSS
jgi:hypothetical protein